ncbi:MAG: VCBS repeat-containing protein [Bryobacteraceae bacterium]
MPKLLVALVSLTVPSLCLASSAKFLDYRDYLVAGTPQALAIADLNRDGIPDIVVGTAEGTQVLLGRGDGTFLPPLTAGKTSVLSVVVADFNNDGVPDIAATLLSNGTHISLALGNGNGTFQPPTLLPIPCVDCYLAAADFNGDGNMDLAVASTSVLVVFPGNGDGTFGSGWPGHGTRFTTAVKAGDVDRDGKPDLVVTDFGAGTVIVLLGNGSGAFQRTDYPVGDSPFQTVLADFNGDGLPDLAAVDRDTDTVVVLLNQGAGLFGPSASFGAGCARFQGCTLQGVAAGDFTHNGKIDLATPGAILYGNGDGTFQRPAGFVSGAFPWQVASADFNHDGYADLLVANSAATNVSVLLADARSEIQPLRVAAGNQPKAVATADFNGDGQSPATSGPGFTWATATEPSRPGRIMRSSLAIALSMWSRRRRRRALRQRILMEMASPIWWGRIGSQAQCRSCWVMATVRSDAARRR